MDPNRRRIAPALLSPLFPFATSSNALATSVRLSAKIVLVHELSIASAILDRVAIEAQRRPGARFTKVGVRVGEISGVDPDALSFGFECLVKDTEFDRLPLHIEFCPRMQRCLSCTNEFTASDSMTACPRCGHEMTECIGGEELDLAFIEIEEAGETPQEEVKD